MDEAGLQGLYINIWYGLWAPEGTPNDNHRKAQSRRRGRHGRSAVKKRFADLGLDMPPPDQQSAAGARRAAKGRDREVVADHQGRRDQGGVMELIRLDAGVLDHLAPFRGFRGDELAEISRRAAVHDDADIGKPLLDLVVGQRRVDLFVERCR